MRIFLKAFLDQNLGDDLMLFRLFEEFPDVNFYLTCSSYYEEYESILAKYPNVELTHTELYQIEQFEEHFFDGILLLGGSVLQGNRMKGCYYRYRNIRLIRRFQKTGGKYWILGCNTGPFMNRITEYFVKLELKCADAISTRDLSSERFIRSTVSRRTPVLWADDILMDIMQQRRITWEPVPKRLGISLILPQGLREQKDRLSGFYRQLICEYLSETDRTVTLFCFNSGHQNDRELADEICREEWKDHPGIHTELYDPRMPDHFLKAIASCETFLPGRFHSLILASSLQIPVFPLSYDQKMDMVFRDHGYRGRILRLKELDDSAASGIYRSLQQRTELFRLEHREYGSHKHFQFLREQIMSIRKERTDE